ncbi:hypothetical protein GCM10009767_13850 [Kocuria aegyptia]|uniref:Uncharacterized protein n=1 Tax=Kocuria aegyptia TaxID=330943 RepID=A0ABN2KGQ9_9MICC
MQGLSSRAWQQSEHPNRCAVTRPLNRCAASSQAERQCGESRLQFSGDVCTFSDGPGRGPDRVGSYGRIREQSSAVSPSMANRASREHRFCLVSVPWTLDGEFVRVGPMCGIPAPSIPAAPGLLPAAVRAATGQQLSRRVSWGLLTITGEHKGRTEVVWNRL